MTNEQALKIAKQVAKQLGVPVSEVLKNMGLEFIASKK